MTGGVPAPPPPPLAWVVTGVPLPLELELISDRLVGPTLGEKAIDASIEAGIIGIILTGLFIIFVYRLVGLAATVALASYALLAYAMLVGLGSTLTLPGLAGLQLVRRTVRKPGRRPLRITFRGTRLTRASAPAPHGKDTAR